jgi:electron transport complex protein RnfG
MKNIIVFIILTMIAATLLAGLYLFSEPRKQGQIQLKQEAIVQRLLQSHEASRIQEFELLAPRYLHMGDVQTAQRVYGDDNTAKTVILTVLTEHAYAGRVALLAALNSNCSIESVEVVQSKETPGLGDQYKKNDSAWLRNFQGKSLDTNKWSLKSQGGDFDAWTGATVTPKAIVAALGCVLELCEAHQAALFSDREIVYLEQ